MSDNSFKRRQIVTTITLSSGTFGSSGNNTLKIEGMRQIISIQFLPPPSSGQIQARIFGLSASDMNQMTYIAGVDKRFNQPLNKNIITVEADGTTVYAGDISNAWIDYSGSPDVCMYLQGYAGLYYKLKPAEAISFTGAADVAVIVEKLCKQMGYTFENNNVTAKIATPYLPGTGLQQIEQLCLAANLAWGIDSGVLFIANKGFPRKSTMPKIGPLSGLIGYPSMDINQVNFRCLFNPALKWMGSVELDTDVERAKGKWQVIELSYQLESENPDGAFFQTVRGGSINE